MLGRAIPLATSTVCSLCQKVDVPQMSAFGAPPGSSIKDVSTALSNLLLLTRRRPTDGPITGLPFDADHRHIIFDSAYEVNSVPLPIYPSLPPCSLFSPPQSLRHLLPRTHAIGRPWKLSCASRGPCARSCTRRPPPRFARCPPLRPLTRSRLVQAACPTSRCSPGAAPSWARPSPSKVLAVETAH